MAALLREFRERAFEDTGLDWDRRACAILDRIDGKPPATPQESRGRDRT
jgi:hypothetical protein